MTDAGPPTPEQTQLASLLTRRKTRLRDRWIDIATRGGTTLETLRRIRAGLVDVSALRDDTRTALDIGLRLPLGTVDKVLDGANADQFVTMPITPTPPILGAPDDIDPELRATYRRIRDRHGKTVAQEWYDKTLFLRDSDQAASNDSTA